MRDEANRLIWSGPTILNGSTLADVNKKLMCSRGVRPSSKGTRNILAALPCRVSMRSSHYVAFRQRRVRTGSASRTSTTTPTASSLRSERCTRVRHAYSACFHWLAFLTLPSSRPSTRFLADLQSVSRDRPVSQRSGNWQASENDHTRGCCGKSSSWTF
eukprot:1888694-Pleurochrysis_carterae.AAC.2